MTGQGERSTQSFTQLLRDAEAEYEALRSRCLESETRERLLRQVLRDVSVCPCEFGTGDYVILRVPVDLVHKLTQSAEIPR